MLKKIFISIVLIIFSSSYSYSSELSNSLVEFTFSNKEINKANIGIKIFDLDKNKSIYSYNDKSYFIPASNLKIVTTLVSLEYLGQDFQFETKLKTDKIYKNHINNLYLELSSDPLFTSKDLDSMIKKLKEKGIEKINSNIYIYNNKIDNKVYGKGWMYDDFDHCYSSQIGKYIIDKNCLRLSITENLNIESPNPVDFIVTSYDDNFKVFSFDIENLSVLYGGNAIKNYNYELAINNPQKYLEKVLLKMLFKNNIDFKGNILWENNNNSKVEIYTHKSIPLKEILKIFNKESDNLIGEILLKTISNLKNKKEGSTNDSINIINEYFINNFEMSNFRIVDGSGLSRYNILTPDLIIECLKKLYSKYKDIVLNSFPLGGIEGTLKNRLKNIEKDFKVIAKSGSMTSVNCLSGYIISENGNIAFSIMINNSLESPQKLRDFQDNIINIIVNNYLK